MLLSVDLHEDFIEVEGIAKALVLSLQATGINGTEFYAPDGIGNNVRWESVAFVCVHPTILSIWAS